MGTNKPITDPDGLLPGRLLGRQAIAQRIADGDIFASAAPDDWREANLRGAAYDLRLAKDYLITPDGRAFGPGQEHTEYLDEYLILKPGDVAFVATREKLRLQWDIAANIAPKYDVTRHGLFVFYGTLVDPGYGVGREDERLHFLVANVGSKDCVLKPGEHKIAALQFFAVEPVVESERQTVQSAVAIWQEMAKDPERLRSGLAFFEKTARGTKRLKRRVEQLDVANERVIAFGIYVLAAALLGMSLAALVAIFGSTDQAVTISFKNFGSLSWAGAALLVLTIALGVVLGRAVGSVAKAVYSRRPHDGAEKAGRR